MDRESHVGQSTVYDVYLYDTRFDYEMNRCAGIKVVRKRSRMACIGTEKSTTRALKKPRLHSREICFTSTLQQVHLRIYRQDHITIGWLFSRGGDDGVDDDDVPHVRLQSLLDIPPEVPHNPAGILAYTRADLHTRADLRTRADLHTQADLRRADTLAEEGRVEDSSPSEWARTTDDPPFPTQPLVPEHTNIPFHRSNVARQVHVLASRRVSSLYACPPSQGL
jgi:hypothetical protein